MKRKDQTEQLVYLTTDELLALPGSCSEDIVDVSPQLAKLIASKGVDAERFIKNHKVKIYKINDDMWYIREQQF
jgi:hypothetical protein